MDFSPHFSDTPILQPTAELGKDTLPPSPVKYHVCSLKPEIHVISPHIGPCIETIHVWVFGTVITPIRTIDVGKLYLLGLFHALKRLADIPSMAKMLVEDDEPDPVCCLIKFV